MSPDYFIRLVSTASITDLVVFFRAALGAVAAVEAAGNLPMSRSSTVLAD